MRYTFIGMVEDSLSAREARVLRECSAKKPSELSDEMMSEFSEVAQKAKATLLANITTLSIDRLMTLLVANRSNINELLFGKGLVGRGFAGIGNFLNQTKAKESTETIALGYFGEMIKGDFTGKEFDEFFALVKARSEYIDGKIDDFDDKKESRLDELANKAKGIIIGKIEPLEATKLFAYPLMTLNGKEPSIV